MLVSIVGCRKRLRLGGTVAFVGMLIGMTAEVDLMTALGAKVERVIINDLKNATYYARAIIRAENELQQKKIIELDARPSDCIAIATQQKAPIYVSQEVWEEVDDMSDVLRKMEEEGLKPDPETESEE